MTKRIQAKYKIDRRLGQNIWGRPKSPVNRRDYRPGQQGQKRRAKLSDFGLQLRAKQKLKGYYGNITEKQFRRLYAEAGRIRGDTGENLVGLLECRLDTIVYRAKLAPTVFAARQVVSHGHVSVNGRKLKVPSARLKAGDKIKLSDKAKAMPSTLAAVESEEREVPDYINSDHDKMTASYTRVPLLEDVPYPVRMDPQLVVEYYSR